VYVAAAPSLKGKSGLYYGDCKEMKAAPFVTDIVVSEKLWELSAKQCKLDEALDDLKKLRLTDN